MQYGDQEAYKTVRSEICNYMRQNPNVIGPWIFGDYNAYVNRMETNGIHGGQEEITVVSRMYGHPIHVYRNNLNERSKSTVVT